MPKHNDFPASGNLYQLPDAAGYQQAELFETLFENKAVKLERIVSCGQSTPPGEWYDQDKSEWVLLLQGTAQLQYADGSTQTLQAGDHVLLPAHFKHRVGNTSTEPPCIWLAVFF